MSFVAQWFLNNTSDISQTLTLDSDRALSPVASRRATSSRLAHTPLAQAEDLQGGQYVLVHPDPCGLWAQPPVPASQPFRESAARA